MCSLGLKLSRRHRVVFTEETNPQNYLKLIASGDVDGTMLEALEDYVKRQKKRLAMFSSPPDYLTNRPPRDVAGDLWSGLDDDKWRGHQLRRP